MSDYTTITDRINSLYADESGLISRREVLAIVANAVPVEIDMDMYSEVLPESNDEQKEVLAIISTVYNLLADKAAEFAARDVRKQAGRAGLSLIPDAEMFAKNKANPGPGLVTSYHDLAAHNADRVEDLGKILEALIDESTREATMGLVTSMTADLGLEGLLGDLHGGLDL